MNVLIVDDEPIIRVGLRTLIEWDKYGFLLVGEASDGEEALSLMKEQQVDMLVTDIKMPRMDGLELIRLAKKQHADIGIVVLSCLDDFSFVKEAMKLGARDYILKPTMEPDELVAILQAIRISLLEERQEKARIVLLNEQLEQSRPYRLQAQLRGFFDHGILEDELERELFKDGRRLYSLAIFSQTNDHYSLNGFDLDNVLLAVRLQDKSHLLLFDCDSSVSANEWYQLAFSLAESLLRYWLNDIDNDAASQVPVICVGPPLHDVFELPLRLEYHRQQFASRFYGTARGYIVMEQPQIGTEETAFPIAVRNHMLRAVAGGNDEAVRHSIQEMLTMISETKPEISRLQAYIFETIGLVIGYAREHGYEDIHELEQQYLSMELISSFYSFKELAVWIQAFIRELCNSREGYKGNRSIQHPFIRKAVAYIRERYSYNISTADIAEHVKLSRSYLSDLYSKEMGESLTETLTRIRIEEACKQLTTTDKKIYEIAENVGFNDSKTFTKTFKRMMGCSPKEYVVSNK